MNTPSLRLAVAPLLAALALALPLLPQDGPVTRPAAELDATDAPAVENPSTPVTVIAVRHAEKADDDPRDPSLTEAGGERAKDLAELLGAAGITHVFTTPYRRTTATVAPLAEALGLDVIEYSPRSMADFLERLRGLPAGSVAVVSGHSNTTPGLVLALGGDISELETVQGAPSLGHEEYDRLFVLTLGDEDTRTATLELRYGEASEH